MGRLLSVSAAVAAAALAALTPAAAQPAPPGPAPTPPPARPVFAPTVDDPLLAPPPPAPRALASWAEATSLLAATPAQGRATAEVARSRAAARAAAAARRPIVTGTAGLAIDLVHPTVAPGVPPGPDYTPTAPLGTAAVVASWSVIDVAARRARATAAADLRGAEASQVDVARRTALVAADAVVAVLAATRAAELTRQGLRLALERAALGARTHELGAATELDAIRTAPGRRGRARRGDRRRRAAPVAREAWPPASGEVGELDVAAALTADALLAQLAAQCRPLGTGEERADVVSAARRRRGRARPPGRGRGDQAAGARSRVVGLGLHHRSGPGAGPGVDAGAGAAGADLGRRTPRRRRRPARRRGRRRAGGDRGRAARGRPRDRARPPRRRRRRRAGRRRHRGPRSGARVDAMTRRSFEIGRATSLELVQSAGVLAAGRAHLALREAALIAAEVEAMLTEARCVP
jgi:hypothetical protein